MKILCLDRNRRIRPRTCKEEEEEERRIEVYMSCSDWELCNSGKKDGKRDRWVRGEETVEGLV
jgi:hypothetical protein